MPLIKSKFKGRVLFPREISLLLSTCSKDAPGEQSDQKTKKFYLLRRFLPSDETRNKNRVEGPLKNA